ncbi:hypothetical protein UL82_07670 [Corynebacterium kutscheri]|uniref:DUF3558 domain-containing protein n=1 Tax=Corynebacterium kutscheri TaxID=35755 RepID=A0A0F6R166_9CORY|nr:hypothetical protein [Corynebacterium kutscheri]AKE41695.1 hypothetical protein UL82_07670 [Corynebacterium kutscheri]VEH10022.1 Uncharacterised protein [Corynebacterium kutscheri]
MLTPFRLLAWPVVLVLSVVLVGCGSVSVLVSELATSSNSMPTTSVRPENTQTVSASSESAQTENYVLQGGSEPAVFDPENIGSKFFNACEEVIYPNLEKLGLVENPYDEERFDFTPEENFNSCSFIEVNAAEDDRWVTFFWDRLPYEFISDNALWIKHGVSKRLPHAYTYQLPDSDALCWAAVSTGHGRISIARLGSDLLHPELEVSCPKAVQLLEKIYEIGFPYDF